MEITSISRRIVIGFFVFNHSVPLSLTQSRAESCTESFGLKVEKSPLLKLRRQLEKLWNLKGQCFLVRHSTDEENIVLSKILM